MATHAVAADEIGTTAFQLAASTVDTVNFAVDLKHVEIITDGAAAVWYTFDGTDPTVDGKDCYYLPAAPAVDSREPATSGATVVKLISAGTPKIRVQRGF